MKSRNRLLFFLMALVAGFGLLATQHVQASERTTANVTFSRSALNPANPRLPLADTSGEPSVQPNSTGQKQVVVNTTPEKTKVTPKATATSSSSTAAAATSTRTKLPQTGSVTIPAVLVGFVIVISMGMSLRLLTPRRRFVA